MKARVPVLEGFFTEADGEPRLLGGHCPRCGAWYFPKQWSFCRNPHCEGGPLDDAPLSSRGRLWSWTDNRFAPPPPYPAREPFEPYGVAAVELPDEQVVVLGQLARGTDIGALALDQRMTLVVETLFEDDDAEHTVWKWRPEDSR